MEDDMLEYVTRRTEELGQEAPSAKSFRDNARAKAVRASYEFWSTGDESLLERAFAETFAEHLVWSRCEPTANGLRPSGAPGRREKDSK
jgi:hypothetical protein